MSEISYKVSFPPNPLRRHNRARRGRSEVPVGQSAFEVDQAEEQRLFEERQANRKRDQSKVASASAKAFRRRSAVSRGGEVQYRQKTRKGNRRTFSLQAQMNLEAGVPVHGRRVQRQLGEAGPATEVLARRSREMAGVNKPSRLRAKRAARVRALNELASSGAAAANTFIDFVNSLTPVEARNMAGRVSRRFALDQALADALHVDVSDVSAERLKYVVQTLLQRANGDILDPGPIQHYGHSDAYQNFGRLIRLLMLLTNSDLLNPGPQFSVKRTHKDGKKQSFRLAQQARKADDAACEANNQVDEFAAKFHISKQAAADIVGAGFDLEAIAAACTPGTEAHMVHFGLPADASCSSSAPSEEHTPPQSPPIAAAQSPPPVEALSPPTEVASQPKASDQTRKPLDVKINGVPLAPKAQPEPAPVAPAPQPPAAAPAAPRMSRPLAGAELGERDLELILKSFPFGKVASHVPIDLPFERPPCEHCAGTGQHGDKKCEDCDGLGHTDVRLTADMGNKVRRRAMRYNRVVIRYHAIFFTWWVTWILWMLSDLPILNWCWKRGKREQVIDYCPHMLATAIRELPLHCSVEDARANMRARLLRLPTLPLPDHLALPVTDDTEFVANAIAPNRLNRYGGSGALCARAQYGPDYRLNAPAPRPAPRSMPWATELRKLRCQYLPANLLMKLALYPSARLLSGLVHVITGCSLSVQYLVMLLSVSIGMIPILYKEASRSGSFVTYPLPILLLQVAFGTLFGHGAKGICTLFVSRISPSGWLSRLTLSLVAWSLLRFLRICVVNYLAGVFVVVLLAFLSSNLIPSLRKPAGLILV